MANPYNPTDLATASTFPSTTSTSTSTSTSQPRPRPRLLLPQPSFAPIPLTRTAPIPSPKHDTKTPKSSLYQCPVRHLSLRLASGRSTAYQSRNDPSVSFYLYVPSSHPVSRRWHGDLDLGLGRVDEGGTGNGTGIERDVWDGYGEFQVVVLIHGSVRDAERLRNSWAERAEREGVVIVAPLWPGRIDFPHGPNGYKYLKYPEDGSPSAGTRYDLTLFDILEQVKQDWGFLDIDRFGLAGYSGGGQFVHRMLYLHPDRISAVSVGAPGSSTLLSPEPWPRGTLDTKEIFGIPSPTDPSQFNSTRIQIVVGSEDHYHPLNDDGTEFHLSRYGIAQELHDNWIQNGVEHDWVVVEGGWHETDLFRPIVQDFIFGTGTMSS